MLVPGRLAIVMGVHVDEARRHDFPRSIDRFVGRVSGKRADGFDNTVFDADILVLGRGARPVIDLAISDKDIGMGHSDCSACKVALNVALNAQEI